MKTSLLVLSFLFGLMSALKH